MQFFSLASDGLEKELHPSEEYGAENVLLVYFCNRKFRKWWAQYIESTGDMENALKFYQQAGDPLSLVRVYSYCDQLEKV